MKSYVHNDARSDSTDTRKLQVIGYFTSALTLNCPGIYPSSECCDMSQYDTIGKIELIPASVLSTDKTNC